MAGFVSGGNPAAIREGWAIGTVVGGVVDSASQKPQSIGRLSDLRLTGSQFGVAIPWIYGKQKLPGNIIWWAGLRETKNKKGSKLTGTRATVYSYSVDVAVAVCRGPVTRVKKIWAEDTLLYDADNGLTPAWIRIYLGTTSQTPDSLIAADRLAKGDEAPAYRNLCYVVFDDLPLAEYGNRVPNFAFLVENTATYGDETAGDGAYILYSWDTETSLLNDSGSAGFNLTDSSSPNGPVSSTTSAAVNQAVTLVSGVSNASDQLNHVTGVLAQLTPVDLTVETWFRYNGGSIGAVASSRFSFHDSSLSQVWDLRVQNDLTTNIQINFNVSTSVSNFQNIHTFTFARDTSWHHIAVVYQGLGNSLLYVDGVLQQTVAAIGQVYCTPTATASFVRVVIGRNSDFDETAYYPVALSAAQISSHYTRTFTTKLKHVLADVFQQAGLTSDQYDVSQATDTVRGLLIGDRTEARSAIDAALRSFFVDLVEADSKIKAVKRGGSIVATIDADDLGAEMVESGLPEPKAVLVAKRGQELELPRRVEVLYTSEDTQYLAGNQDAKRYTKGHLQGELSFPTNLVFTNAEARLVAERLLYHAWIERETFEFSLPPKYLGLLPSDPVSLPIAGGTARVRLTRVDLALPGPLQCTAVLDEPTILTQEAAGGASEANTDPATPCVDTALVAWNGNAARDEDADSIGLYVVMNCSTPAVATADAAAQFTNGPYLFHNQTGEFSVPAGTDMTVDLWFEFDSLPAGLYIKMVGTEGGTVGTDGWYLQRDGTTGLVTFGYSTGAAYKELGTITPTTGVWYHGSFSYNHTGPFLSAVVQNTSTVLFSGSTSPVGAMNVSTQSLRLGFGVGGSIPLTGRMDSVCVMSRLLTGGDMDLYNSGSGRKFADLAGNAILTGMTAFYNLDEASATVTWTDAHVNGYNLTQAGGSVLSVPKRGLF